VGSLVTIIRRKKLGFARFLSAGADSMHEILAGNAIVGLAIIGAHTGGSANQLIDQSIVHRAVRNLLGEENDGSPNLAVRSSKS
jgi:hypothetical protein